MRIHGGWLPGWARRCGAGRQDLVSKTGRRPRSAVDVGSDVRWWFLEVFVGGVPNGMHCLGGLATCTAFVARTVAIIVWMLCWSVV